MIVPMKKVSVFVLDSERKSALKALRKLGLVHIEISSGSGERLAQIKERISVIESGMFILSDKINKNTVFKQADSMTAYQAAEKICDLNERIKLLRVQKASDVSELERLRAWGEIDPDELCELSKKGIKLHLCEMPFSEYKKLDDNVTTIPLTASKNLVRFLEVEQQGESPLKAYRVQLPELSTEKLKQKISDTDESIKKATEEIAAFAELYDSMKKAVEELHKELQFEIYATGMDSSVLSENPERAMSVAFFKGYIPAEDADKLKQAASKNSWGLLLEDPQSEDDVPTKLKNNKFVSLIYPLTDFLGTVPGYFEYDISGWFLGFILVFFGIIFGDGGYGLIICAAATALLASSYKKTKTLSPTFLLVLLLGGATVIWGLVTCTWFGLSPQQLPVWLQKLSVPVISNVYADKLWYPPWTNGRFGLTTAQNVQIFCFSLALVQLTAAHIKGMVRNKGSLKLLSDLGSILQLVGIFYVVLALVVNGQVFSLGLVIGGVPVGTVAIALVGVGFAMSFVFANYEGSVGKSILESLKNIVSVLLGVVNVFSDIVSYIRLWAVGLAGAAISATVNELAGPLLGNFMFMVLAIVLLVFGHGLNMILNVLSVIVHGVRLNTLEFSSHLDMSWSGHKYQPFEE